MRSVLAFVAAVFLGLGLMLAGCQHHHHHHATTNPASAPASTFST